MAARRSTWRFPSAEAALRGLLSEPGVTIVSASAFESRLEGNTAALDAKHRSSIYNRLVPLLGEDDANALMTEFPASEADELVTKEFLRAELAELTNRSTVRIVGLIVGFVAMIEALTTLA